MEKIKYCHVPSVEEIEGIIEKIKWIRELDILNGKDVDINKEIAKAIVEYLKEGKNDKRQD